ncbi:cytosolic purine 5'-nucleotidase-like [Hyaena hyaena]|uniref:cytosolic purine 5'-nucleotidase-like n=1 Tax=Hyaena hyaena TaxID=95912 RepID=UPI001922512C|nr:cytosolic purine 5'-nucleotidase-like [Hyaena hyaena]
MDSGCLLSHTHMHTHSPAHWGPVECPLTSVGSREGVPGAWRHRSFSPGSRGHFCTRHTEVSRYGLQVINSTKREIQRVTGELGLHYGAMGSRFRCRVRQTFFSNQQMHNPDLCTAAFLHYPLSWLYRVAPELMPHVSAVEQERANPGPSSCPAFYSQRVTMKDSK